MRLCFSGMALALASIILCASAAAAENSVVMGAPENITTQAGLDLDNYYHDKVGGAIWRRCDIGKKILEGSTICTGNPVLATWPEAVAAVQNLNEQRFEGASDWRLPSRRDLRNLLLNATGIREPVGTQYYRYGFGPANLTAIYDDGTKVDFGGQFPGRNSDQCRLAADFVMKSIGNGIGLTGEPASSSSYSNPANHRWLSNNETWTSEGRVSASANEFQNPITINFSATCDYIVAAFFRSDKTFNLSGTLRPHATLPILVIRGGSSDRSWADAQGAAARSKDIIAQSVRDTKTENAALAAVYIGIGNAVRDVIQSGLSSGGASSSSIDTTTNKTINSGTRTFVCEYKCTNAKFIGSERTTMSIRVQASSRGAAEDETIRHGKATCYQQTQRVWDTGSQHCRPE